MKSNSLGRFRRRRKLKKFLLILCALAAGLLAAAEARFAVSRVSLIEQQAGERPPAVRAVGDYPVGARALLAVVLAAPQRVQSFDRGLLSGRDRRCRSRAGANFSISARPLVPVYRVYWGGRLWYLSAEGKLWLASLAENQARRRRRRGQARRCSPGGRTARRR